MLDLLAVQEQLQEYHRFQVEEEEARASRMNRAMAALQACSAEWEALAGVVDGRPAVYESPTILVGGSESYEARCRHCHDVPRADADQGRLW